MGPTVSPSPGMLDMGIFNTRRLTRSPETWILVHAEPIQNHELGLSSSGPAINVLRTMSHLNTHKLCFLLSRSLGPWPITFSLSVSVCLFSPKGIKIFKTSQEVTSLPGINRYGSALKIQLSDTLLGAVVVFMAGRKW